ncbi:LysE family translocator [Nonomuraea sp. B10E15]|uniref:LysE family translocator n=1 Tax=unclassified Nonomuraea TaxID=2593643 RepID=UPI00325F6162
MTLGIQFGTLIWGVLTAAGLSALLAASETAYQVLRWAGVAYLVWMGLRMILTGAGAHALPEQQAAGFRKGFGRGLVTNLLNPKVGVFYVAMLPQFIPEEAPHAVMGLLLAGVHVVEGLLWSVVLIWFASMMSGFLRSPGVRRFLDRLTGVVIVGFGVRLAFTD